MQGWSGMGGAKLKTSRTTPAAIGLELVAQKFKKFNIHGLLIIGGFEVLI